MEMQFQEQLMLLLDISSRFCACQRLNFGMALKSLKESAQRRNSAEARIIRKGWEYTEVDEAQEEEKQFHHLAYASTLKEVKELGIEFNRALQKLLSMLHEKVNAPPLHSTMDASSDLSPAKQATPLQQSGLPQSTFYGTKHNSLGFLTFRLDFSEYYHNQQIEDSAKNASTK